jgi:hypothetical protein
MGKHLIGGKSRHPAPVVWFEVGDGMPLEVLLETKRDGEPGSNRCRARLKVLGGKLEWIEPERMSQITDGPVAGRSTADNPLFLPPTHWRRIPQETGL